MKKIMSFRNEQSVHLILLILLMFGAIWSAINPFNTLLWVANISVAFIYAFGFIVTYKRFKFTSFSYFLIFIHLIIIIIAAKYTYENTPLFNIIRDQLGHSRNNFDRIGHFFQGFVPVILVREFFLRLNYMKKSNMFNLVIIFFTLAISASWELLEFVGAVGFNKTDAYDISSQGDVWDAQWDMVLALIGAITSLLIFSKFHDKEMKKVEEKELIEVNID